MDTQDIRCFRLVYEERSITRAAQQLFITPQGLSRTIRRLENELSVTLFERTKYVTVHTGCKGLEVRPDGVLCETADHEQILVPGTISRRT